MPYINKDELLNSLTDQEIINICTELGNGNYKKDSHGNLCFNTCLCHKDGDSPYKLIYYKNPTNGVYNDYKTPVCHCFTCSFTGSMVELVIRSFKLKGRELSWYQALNWIANFTGRINQVTETGDFIRTKRIEDFDWINPILSIKNRRQKGIPHLKEIPETYLECFTYLPHEEWLNDGVDRDAHVRFEISYYPLSDQIVIPHRDSDGRLIGIRGRYLSKCDIENIGKYVPISLNGYTLSHSLGSVLYGLWVTKDKIKECKKALIVEGEKSCLKAYSMFHDNSYVVATCGSSISLTHQKILLNELGVEEIIYMPDKDYKGDIDSLAAKAWFQKQKKKVAPFVPYCKVYIMMDTDNTWEYKSNAFDFNDKEKFIEEYDKKVLVTMDSLKEEIIIERKEEDEEDTNMK